MPANYGRGIGYTQVPVSPLDSGFTATYPRHLGITSQAAVASQVLALTYFTCNRPLLAANAAFIVGSTQAAATPTVIRYGLYTEAANGDITLVASTPNDTTMLANTNTKYSKAFSVAHQMIVGQRYALGHLVVSATTMPILMGYGMGATSAINTESNTAPRVTASVTGQADLPASVADAGFTATRIMFYGTLTA